jgi:hydroxymethylbilane synthase
MTNKIEIKIGTRGSKLAIYQAEKVKYELERTNPHIYCSINIIKTKGDKILDVPLSKIGDKGLFTKELEIALINKDIDIAVHSLKDLPTTLPQEIMLGGVLQRDEVRDALISNKHKKFSELNENDVIATSSLRRKAQLLSFNPNFNIIDIRGNLDTRLQKLKDNYCTALLVSAAGMIRLGLKHKITEIIPPEIIIPATGQGVIAIEIRNDDKAIANLINKINHYQTFISIEAERTFLKTLEGGCQIPIGAYTKIEENNFTIYGFISNPDGSNMLKNYATGKITEAKLIAQKLAIELYNKGAKNILDNLRNYSI